MILARMGEKDFPPPFLFRKEGDELGRERKKLRSVLYVAGSRARERMAIAYTGKPAKMLS